MNKRKLISLLLVLSMLLSMSVVGTAATLATNISAWDELTKTTKNALLASFYDYLTQTTPTPTASELLDRIKNTNALKPYIDTTNTSTSNDGMISESMLFSLCQRMVSVSNIQILKDFDTTFDSHLTNDVYIALLKLSTNPKASKGTVAVEISSRIKGIFTRNGNVFVKLNSADALLREDLGIKENGPTDELLKSYGIDAYFETYLTKINNNIASNLINADDVEYAFKAYNLLYTPTTGGSTGLQTTTTPAPTPTAKPSPTVAPKNTEEAKVIIDKAAETLSNPNATDEQKVEAIGAVGDSLGSMAEMLLGADGQAGNEELSKLVSTVETQLEKLQSAAATLATDEKKAEVNTTLSNMITKTGSNITPYSSQTQIKTAAQVVAKTLITSASIIDKVESAEKAEEMATQAIDSVKSLLDKTGTGAKEVKKVLNDVTKLAEKAVEKQAKKVVAAKEEKVKNEDGTEVTKLVSKITDELVSEIETQLTKITETATKLEEKLKATDKNAKVEKKLIIKAEATSTEAEVEAQIPATLFAKVKDSAIDKVKVDTGAAALSVEPDFIEMPAGSTVSLSVNNKELTADEKDKLSDDQKKLVASGAKVFDFNAAVVSEQGQTSKVSSFKKKIDVSIPYTPATGENPEKITVLFFNETTGKVENMIGNYDAVTGTVNFKTDHFSKYIVKSVDVDYSDVQDSAWYAKYVEVLTSKGIISGNGEGKYNPNGKVTRAEFATMVALAKQLTLGESKATFPDVDSSAWYAKYVLAAADDKIISGYTDGSFGPMDNILREQMCVMLVNALGDQAPDIESSSMSFKDKNSISSYAKTAVAKAVNAGFIAGNGDNNFAPKDCATRAEAATIIYLYFFYNK